MGREEGSKGGGGSGNPGPSAPPYRGQGGPGHDVVLGERGREGGEPQLGGRVGGGGAGRGNEEGGLKTLYFGFFKENRNAMKKIEPEKISNDSVHQSEISKKNWGKQSVDPENKKKISVFSQTAS